MRASLSRDRLRGLERHVFVRHRIREAPDPAEPRLAHARTDAPDAGELPDRRDQRALVDERLHALQDRGALGAVELADLLLEQRVDLRLRAVDVGAALDRERLQTGRGVAEG